MVLQVVLVKEICTHTLTKWKLFVGRVDTFLQGNRESLVKKTVRRWKYTSKYCINDFDLAKSFVTHDFSLSSRPSSTEAIWYLRNLLNRNIVYPHDLHELFIMMAFLNRIWIYLHNLLQQKLCLRQELLKQEHCLPSWSSWTVYHDSPSWTESWFIFMTFFDRSYVYAKNFLTGTLFILMIFLKCLWWWPSWTKA